MFLEISQNSHENTCARVSFLDPAQVFSCEFCEIFKNSFFYRTAPDDYFWSLKENLDRNKNKQKKHEKNPDFYKTNEMLWKKLSRLISIKRLKVALL